MKKSSLSYLQNYFNQELLCAKKECSSQKVVELSECLHHLKMLTGVISSIGGYPVASKEECNTWVTDPDDGLYVVRIPETLFNKLDIADELVTGYDIEDGCENNGKYYFLLQYVGE